MTALFTENFTDSNGTLLSAHTAGGVTWAERVAETSGTKPSIQSNQFGHVAGSFVSGAATYYVTNPLPAGRDQHLNFNIVLPATKNNFGEAQMVRIGLRNVGGAGSGAGAGVIYYLYMNADSTYTHYLYAYDSGGTLIANNTYTFNHAAGATVAMEIDVTGDVATLKVAGTNRITLTPGSAINGTTVGTIHLRKACDGFSECWVDSMVASYTDPPQPPMPRAAASRFAAAQRASRW